VEALEDSDLSESRKGGNSVTVPAVVDKILNFFVPAGLLVCVYLLLKANRCLLGISKLQQRMIDSLQNRVARLERDRKP
jgi:hypothetical protein